MPRRQRFKPSRKPKPAIELSESEIIQPTAAKPTTIDQDNHDLNVGQHESRNEQDSADDHATG